MGCRFIFFRGNLLFIFILIARKFGQGSHFAFSAITEIEIVM